MDRLRDAVGARLPDLAFEELLVLGLFGYEKLPMVDALQKAAAHSLMTRTAVHRTRTSWFWTLTPRRCRRSTPYWLVGVW
ncbi:MAG: hypothetical protein ACRDYA_20130 [Egibacteraceae bacterium]